jgi:hypothetical protein
MVGNQLFQTDDAKKVENVFKDIPYSPPLYKARRMASTYDLEAVDGKEVAVNQEYSVLYDLGDTFEQWFIKISPNALSIDCMTAKRRKIYIETCVPFTLDVHEYYRCGYFMKDLTFGGDNGNFRISLHSVDDENEYEKEKNENMGSVEIQSDVICVELSIPHDIAELAQMIACGCNREYLMGFVEKSEFLHKLR